MGAVRHCPRSFPNTWCPVSRFPPQRVPPGSRHHVCPLRDNPCECLKLGIITIPQDHIIATASRIRHPACPFMQPLPSALRAVPLRRHPPGCAWTPGFLNRRKIGHHEAKKAGEGRADPPFDKPAIPSMSQPCLRMVQPMEHGGIRSIGQTAAIARRRIIAFMVGKTICLGENICSHCPWAE